MLLQHQDRCTGFAEDGPLAICMVEIWGTQLYGKQAYLE